MNRLTKRYANGDAGIGALSDGIMATAYTGLSFDEIDAITAVIDKLADFEDAEEQGRLVRLPCKVGDTVYILVGSSREHMLPNKYEQEKCEGFYIGDDNIAQIRVSHRKENHATYGVMNETVFLTREGAEKALRECGNV